MMAAFNRRWGLWALAAVAAAAAGAALNAGIASAHQGIPPGQTPATAWGFVTNPVPSLFLLGAVYLYVNGLNNWPNPTHRVNAWQKACFFAGILVLFAALQSPIEPLSGALFLRPPGATPDGSHGWPAADPARRAADAHAARNAHLGSPEHRPPARPVAPGPLDLRQDYEPGVHHRHVPRSALHLAGAGAA